MTKFEFEDLTGLKVTEEEYKNIEKMYYAVPNMDKHEFCKRWRQAGNNPLTVELAKQATIANGMLEERNNELEDCHNKIPEPLDQGNHRRSRGEPPRRHHRRGSNGENHQGWRVRGRRCRYRSGNRYLRNGGRQGSRKGH